MPNFDQRKLLERLNQDQELELMPYELNELLEKELSKPEDEMDFQLVDDLLDLLGAENPTRAQQEACWQEIEKRIQPSKKRGYAVVLRRIAAAAAVLVVLFFVSFETAKAFRWTFLLKLLAPVAETFGIYSSNTFDSQHAGLNDDAFIDEDTEYEQLNYASLADMPAEVDGYPVVPAWVPERFEFLQGSIYEDPDMAYITVSYMAEDVLILNTSIFYNDEAVLSYDYERTLSEPMIEELSGTSVSYYQNEDEGMLSASWIVDDAHYHAVGDLTIAEMQQVIEGMLE